MVYNVSPSAVGVIVHKIVGNRYIEKRVNIRVEHVRHSKCRDDFLRRVKENAAKKKEAKASGSQVNVKRQPAQPRDARTIQVAKENAVETLRPIAYDTVRHLISGLSMLLPVLSMLMPFSFAHSTSKRCRLVVPCHCAVARELFFYLFLSVASESVLFVVGTHRSNEIEVVFVASNRWRTAYRQREVQLVCCTRWRTLLTCQADTSSLSSRALRGRSKSRHMAAMMLSVIACI